MTTTLHRFLGPLFAPRLQLAVPVAAVAIMLAVFLIDLLTPLGYVEWILYLLPIGLALFQPRTTLPYALATVATAMIAIGYFTSAPGVDPQLAVINRTLGVVLTWTLAFVAHQTLRARPRRASAVAAGRQDRGRAGVARRAHAAGGRPQRCPRAV